MILLLLGVSPLWGQPDAESLETMIERGLGRAGEQALILADSLKDKPGALPKTFEKGALRLTSYRGWVSGFFPGELWLLYEATGNAGYKALAQEFTERVEPAKQMTSTHDLGFMMSWDPGKRWKYPVIIDNMMNLEMLCFLSHETGVRRYEEIATTHANTTILNHFREDGSSWHVVSYDPGTGQPLVDAAFLAEGILRAPTMIWGRLDGKTKERLVTEWKRSREIRPGESNWLLFASMVEAALLGLSLQGMDGEESVERGGCRCRPSSVKGVSF